MRRRTNRYRVNHFEALERERNALQEALHVIVARQETPAAAEIVEGRGGRVVYDLYAPTRMSGSFILATFEPNGAPPCIEIIPHAEWQARTSARLIGTFGDIAWEPGGAAWHARAIDKLSTYASACVQSATGAHGRD